MHESTPKSTRHPDAWITATALVDAGHSVDLNGVVGHTRGAPTLTFTLALGAIFAIVGLLWPAAGLIGLLAVIGSALVDLDAGNGWVRSFLIRDVGNTIIVWPNNATPHERKIDAPTLLITSPIDIDIHPSNVSARLLLIPFAMLLLAAIAVAAGDWLGPTTPTAAAGILALASLVTWCAGRIGTRHPPGNPARDVWIRAIEQAEKASDIRVIWALTGCGSTHHDGLETLLLNHAHNFPQHNTRVLCLQPSTGVCSRVPMDGRIRPLAADPLLDAMASEAGVPPQTGITGARKALRLGWRAAGICVSADQIHRGTHVVCEIIAQSDAMVRDAKW
jgi:hypothetical protein